MTTLFPSVSRYLCVAAIFVASLPSILFATERRQGPPLNIAGAPVKNAKGAPITYTRAQFAASRRELKRTASKEQTATTSAPNSFVPANGNAQLPFWQYSIFGSGIGASNIVIGPAPGGNVAPEIIIGGSSGSYFGGDDFWQSIRRNPTTGNYDQLFVSPLYSATISRIGLANIVGDSKKEIAVMLADGRIYLYDFASKTELGYIDTGIADLLGLSLTDLDNNGYAELIVTTADDLFVFNNAGNQLWKVTGAGGYDVVAGQMDNDAALEIATTSGKVVDSATHAVQWTRNGGFGVRLRLAPRPGTSYQQLIVAEDWQFVYAYDVQQQLPRWSIHTPQDIGAIQVADVDKDGTPEIIIGDGQWGTVHVHDLITQAEKWHADNPEHGVTDIAVADVDNDGTPDLLWGAGYTSSGSDYLYVANTSGSHNIKWQSVDLEGPFLGPVIGDLDGDGQPELVVCSSFSESTYNSGRIVVFDLATLALRGVSDPVVNGAAWTGVHDLKLRDLEGDGHMEIVIGADYLYDGVAEVYGFGANNAFTLKWRNSERPSGSPFNFIEVADLDGNGTREIIAGNSVAHTGSEGVYVYIYDYPADTTPWHSVALSGGFDAVTGLIVRDLDGNGSKEIAALVTNGDLYTFDGPTRELRSLVQGTGATLLSSRQNPSALIAADSVGHAHFLKYAADAYTEILSPQFPCTELSGINFDSDGLLWTGGDGVLKLRLLPSYGDVWQYSLGNGFGRFVATDVRNGQRHVFSSATHAAAGINYTLPAPTLLSAVSRKNHNGVGTFDIPLPLTGAHGVECRSGGAGGMHDLVLTFNEPVNSGQAQVTSQIGQVQGSPTFGSSQMFMTLKNVTNAHSVTINATNLAATGGAPLASVSFAFDVLEGDVTGSHSVNASDVSLTKARSGQTLNATNFLSDINGNGVINASDVSTVKARSGTGVP